uniref:MHC class II antigen beta chain n=1 Tax=Amblyrhynchus cristatus TaxID=51208 RepID=C6G8G0_AMBCR|nr:MHC class II antigen beta chain [Amblyrhynchus cristatus]
MGFGGILALSLAAAVMVAVISGAKPPAHFLIQDTAECYYSPGGGGGPEGQLEVRFVYRYIYDREELVRFDSARGEFEAVAALGEPDARYWNGQKEVLENARAAADVFCRHNYGIDEPFARARLVQPKLKISATEQDSSSQNTLLICNVARFWPAEIEIKWFRNGKEEKGPTVMTTDLIRNGDWTFQIQVMLETKLERGDVYTCQVDHASFASPVQVQWEPQSDSARSKMWTGVAGLILGLVFMALGFIFFLRSKKGNVLPQPPVALMS